MDEDHTAESRDVRQRFDAIVAGPQTMKIENYSSISDAEIDLRAGFVRAIVYIPADFSQRVDQGNRPRIAFIEDNTDNFVTSRSPRPDAVAGPGHQSGTEPVPAGTAA